MVLSENPVLFIHPSIHSFIHPFIQPQRPKLKIGKEFALRPLTSCGKKENREKKSHFNTTFQKGIITEA
jgi:hypothetical protein